MWAHGLHERRSWSKFRRHIMLQLVLFGYKAVILSLLWTQWSKQEVRAVIRILSTRKCLQPQFTGSWPKFTWTMWWMGRVWQNSVHTLEPNESVRTMWREVADPQREAHQTIRYVCKTPFSTTEEIRLEELEHDFSLPHGTVVTTIQGFGVHKVCARWMSRELS
jgi:hypothetical protein